MTVPILATVRLEHVDGLAADRCDMDLAFLADDATPTTLNGISASIVSFFNTVDETPMGRFIAAYMSRVTNASKIFFYDLTGHLDGSPHGSPVQVNDWTLTAVTDNTGFPAEVAAKFMVTGDLTGILERVPNPDYPPDLPRFFRPAQRRRGGFYFGPLARGSGTAGSGSNVIISSAFTAAAVVAWQRFLDERDDLCIWSRADETLWPVLPNGKVFLDNAFDTIRKRGPKPTVREFLAPV